MKHLKSGSFKIWTKINQTKLPTVLCYFLFLWFNVLTDELTKQDWWIVDTSFKQGGGTMGQIE